MGSNTPNFNLYKPTVGETGWGALVNTNFDTIDSNLQSVNLRSYLAGLGVTNNAGTPTTKFDIAVGQAQDAASGGLMVLSSALTKDISSAWVVGTNQGALGTGVTLTVGQTYHTFLIKRTDTGVVDAYVDTSTSAAGIPPNYTLFRRIFSLLTLTTGATIRQFIQDGDFVQYDPAVLSINGTTATGATTRTLNAPTGINLTALLNVYYSSSADPNTWLASDLAITDAVPLATVAPLGVSGTTANMTQIIVRTNTSAQFRDRCTEAGRTLRVAIIGYWDTRGQDA